MRLAFRSPACVGWALAAACGFDTGGVASGTASVGTMPGDGDTSNVTADDSASATTGAGSDASGDASADASGDASATISSSATTSDGGSDPTTSASDATMASHDASADGSSSAGDTMIEPGRVHHLQGTDQTSCDQPLWCYVGDVWTEYGVPISGQQCFDSPVAPPFELISMHYIVADVSPELTAFDVEVRSRDGQGPTGAFHTVALGSAEATMGSHELVFEPPVMVTDQEFCVGFATSGLGGAAALGMAADVGTAVSDFSFLRIEGEGGCDIPFWTDVIDDLNPTPSGNWCIDVEIREIP